MLKLWRNAAGLEPLRVDCTVERVDGIAIDAVIEPRMRAWYLHLLDTAPPAMLPVSDVAQAIRLEPAGASGAATAQLPGQVRRLLELRLGSWRSHAVPCIPQEQPRRHRLALNPYSAPGAAHPLCTLSGRCIRVMPFSAGDEAVYATAVTDPGPETYTLDESLLSTIPTEIYDEH